MFPIFTKNFKIDFENRKWNYSNRKWDSFSLTICQTYLRHISVNYQSIIRQISGEPQMYLTCISGKSKAYVSQISRISVISKLYLIHNQEYRRNITGIHALYLCNPHASLSPQLYNPVLVLHE